MQSILRTMAVLCVAATVGGPGFGQPHAPGTTAGETRAQFEARTKWWREARFGMFIHWGIYSVPADASDKEGRPGGAAEWYFSNKQAQVKDYEKFAAQFNPVKFDARRWVKTAKDAGMKYIVITSKHHDGFCLWESKYTDYCVTKATPFKRDILKELAAECKRQGIRLCFYHSIMDWHHPDYLPRRPWEKGVRDAAGADLNRYIGYMKNQLTELLTRYGPVGAIWFDGGWEHNAQELHSAEVNRMIRSLQPGIIINDRNQLPEDHSTPEQTIPANALPGGRLWETCMTMNGTWGYARNDHNWKSSEDLIHKLCDIASKGGNFLMNVGPMDTGEFPPAIDQRLAEIGAWMRVNGAAIYGTSKSPFRRLFFDGRVTQKGDVLNVMVFRWPEKGDIALPGLQSRVREARVLGTREPITVVASPDPSNPQRVDQLFLSRPKRLDPVATVIQLKLAGAPVVDERPIAFGPDSQGVITLKASDADIHGATAQYEQGGGKDNVGFWTNAADYVTWDVNGLYGGTWDVELVYACAPGNEGSAVTVAVNDQPPAEAVVESTGSWTDFRRVKAGRVVVPVGRSRLAVRVKRMPRGAVMNLKEVRLTPAR